MTSDRKTSDQSTTETTGVATEDVAVTATLDSSVEPEASTTTAHAAEAGTSVEPNTNGDISSAEDDNETADQDVAAVADTELPAQTSATTTASDSTDAPDTENTVAEAVSISSGTENAEPDEAARHAEEPADTEPAIEQNDADDNDAADGNDTGDEAETDADATADVAENSDTDETATDVDSATATDEEAADSGENTDATTDPGAAVDATEQADSEETAEGEDEASETPEAESGAAEADTTAEDATAEEEADAIAIPADEGFFENSGIRIAWRAWLPEESARGVVVLVHGVAEHSGRYAHVGKRLTDAGFAVYAFDHAGHGESSGPRANIGSIDSAADNVQTVLELAGRELPEAPKFVLGHSMGALIALHLATRGPLDVAGVVVSGPPLEVSAGNTAQRLLAPVLTKLTPNLGVLALDSAAISRDPEVVAAYNKDPLVYSGKLPARTANEILETSIAVKARLDKLTAPTLAMHGGADTIADPASTDLVESSAGAGDLTVKRYADLYHEIFNEPENDEVLNDVVDWLVEHTDND